MSLFELTDPVARPDGGVTFVARTAAGEVIKAAIEGDLLHEMAHGPAAGLDPAATAVVLGEQLAFLAATKADAGEVEADGSILLRADDVRTAPGERFEGR